MRTSQIYAALSRVAHKHMTRWHKQIIWFPDGGLSVNRSDTGVKFRETQSDREPESAPPCTSRGRVQTRLQIWHKPKLLQNCQIHLAMARGVKWGANVCVQKGSNLQVGWHGWIGWLQISSYGGNRCFSWFSEHQWDQPFTNLEEIRPGISKIQFLVPNWCQSKRAPKRAVSAKS